MSNYSIAFISNEAITRSYAHEFFAEECFPKCKVASSINSKRLDNFKIDFCLIDILKNFEKSYPKLVIVTIDEHIKHWPGKKFALTLGIKTANHEYLLLTDADCLPNSRNWAKQMSSNFNDSEI